MGIDGKIAVFIWFFREGRVNAIGNIGITYFMYT